jgi:hypothetical protein
MDASSYQYGFLTTVALLLAEHMLFYRRLEILPSDTRDEQDKKNAARLILGVAAILAGCGVAAYASGNLAAFIAPAGCSTAGGATVLASYVVRGAIRAAERRGRLKGMADRADIAEK